MEEFNRIQTTNKATSGRQMVDSLIDSLNQNDGNPSGHNAKAMMGIPKIIYASRTHSQISQAIQELKRTAYNHMKSAVIGSRDQLCIHPDLEKESNANKIQLCKLKVSARVCHFHNRLDGQKDNPEFKQAQVLDIEDIVRIGKKLKCCPYYASKELMEDADIIFMPYNYLLDPKIRKANKVDLNNTIIILDEAHNVEKMCEESASAQITSSDIAVAIEDVSTVSKLMRFCVLHLYSGFFCLFHFKILVSMIEGNGSLPTMSDDEEKDFTAEDLAILKETLLKLEKAVDEIQLKSSLPGNGDTFEGGYIFGLLEKANVMSQLEQFC